MKMKMKIQRVDQINPNSAIIWIFILFHALSIFLFLRRLVGDEKKFKKKISITIFLWKLEKIFFIILLS